MTTVFSSLGIVSVLLVRHHGRASLQRRPQAASAELSRSASEGEAANTPLSILAAIAIEPRPRQIGADAGSARGCLLALHADAFSGAGGDPIPSAYGSAKNLFSYLLKPGNPRCLVDEHEEVETL
jgi:hypothetical protein